MSSSARTKLLASSETCAQALPRNCGSCVRMAFQTCAQTRTCWEAALQPCLQLHRQTVQGTDLDLASVCCNTFSNADHQCVSLVMTVWQRMPATAQARHGCGRRRRAGSRRGAGTPSRRLPTRLMRDTPRSSAPQATCTCAQHLLHHPPNCAATLGHPACLSPRVYVVATECSPPVLRQLEITQIASALAKSH